MTRRLTPQEIDLLTLIQQMGGSVCPGRETVIPKEGQKSLRRMERAGLLRVEETDDGPRFHLTPAGEKEIPDA